MKIEIPKGYVQLIIDLLNKELKNCMEYGFRPHEWKWIINSLTKQL